jgi:hypothetical protein
VGQAQPKPDDLDMTQPNLDSLGKGMAKKANVTGQTDEADEAHPKPDDVG